MRWAIYYGDGKRFSDEDGSSDDAPSENVQVIAQADETVGRKFVLHKDYYWYENGRWYGGDLFGMYDFLVRSKLVKFGRYISDEHYYAAMKRAADDQDLPHKSAVHPSEKDKGIEV